MKSYRKELWFHTPHRRNFINITPDVEQYLRESGIREGLVLVNAMHITASVFINDDESGLHRDFERGWKNWRRRGRTTSMTTMGARTTRTPTSSARSWAARSSSP